MPRKKTVKLPEEKEKKKFIECPFCRAKFYDINTKDGVSCWCKVCGKSIDAIWKIEE